jgi:hypothetical protein
LGQEVAPSPATASQCPMAHYNSGHGLQVAEHSSARAGSCLRDHLTGHADSSNMRPTSRLATYGETAGPEGSCGSTSGFEIKQRLMLSSSSGPYGC